MASMDHKPFIEFLGGWPNGSCESWARLDRREAKDRYRHSCGLSKSMTD